MAGSSRGRSSSPSRPPWEASSSGLGSLRSSGPAGPPPPSSGQRVVSFSSHRLGRTAAPLAPRSRALAAAPFGGLLAVAPPVSPAVHAHPHRTPPPFLP